MLLILLNLLAVLSFGAELDPAGKAAGESLGNKIKGQYSGGNNVGNKLMKPLTGEQKAVINPEGKELHFNSPLCGKGQITNKRTIMRIATSGSSVSIQFSSDGNNLDRSYSFSARWHCPSGYCASDRNSCVELSIQNGQIVTTSTGALDACVEVNDFPQPPTFIGAKLINDLTEDYKARSIKVGYSDVVIEGSTANYYGGELEACQGQQDTLPSETGLADNPYELPDRAFTYYMTCDPKTDGTCRVAHNAYENTYANNSNSQLASCTIKRNFYPPGGPPREDDRICVPNKRVYPIGYSEANQYCMQDPTDRWNSYSSAFYLECSPDGKSYTLKGWGYWEGAPCGGAKRFPPEPQIEWAYNFNAEHNWVQLGQLSVDRRRGGEDLTNPDLVSPQEKECVSNEPTPYKVWAKNTVNTYEYSLLEIKVDNAPACNQFQFKVQGLVGENLSDSCENYEKQKCVLWNEWWVTADGKRIQTLKEGSPTAIASQCEEIQRDSDTQSWTSTKDTYQTPPQNCVGIKKSCKFVPETGRTECRQWWEKIREYKCSNTAQFRPDTTLAEKATTTARYNPETGEFSFSMKDASTDCTARGECIPLTRTLSVYICSVTSKEYESPGVCEANCYKKETCAQEIESWKCAVDGQEYATRDLCIESCLEPGTCSDKYYCPLNNTGYASQETCMSNCNNCLNEGSCTSVQKYVCSANNQEYSSESICQSSCQANGNCTLEYYCPTGSLQGTQCVANPSCPSGSTYNPSTKKCEAPPYCSSPGYYSQAYRSCIAQTEQDCVITSAYGYYSYPGGSGSTYISCYNNSCSTTVYFTLGGQTTRLYMNLSASYSSYYNSVLVNAYARASNSSFYNYNRSSGYQSCGSIYRSVYISSPWGSISVTLSGSASWQNTCPYPYYYSGGVCKASPYCPSGFSFNSSVGKCQSNPSCPSGFSWNGSQCVKQAQTGYRCSENGQLYSTSSQCASACVISGTCSPATKYRCSISGTEYDTEAACRTECQEQVPNCCQVSQYCEETGQYYDGQCSEQCKKPAQCSPKYKYTCPLNGQVYYDNTTCSQECKKNEPCESGQKTVQRYACSLTLTEYSTQSNCTKNCDSSYNCLTGDYKTTLWTEEFEECEQPMCLIKVPGTTTKTDYELVECVKTGQDTWSCPASSGSMVEDCSCDLESGLTLPVGYLGVITDALNDRTCD